MTRYPYIDIMIYGADLGGGCRGCAPPPPLDEAFFFVLAFKICLLHRSVTSFLRGAPPPNKNPGSAPDRILFKREVQFYASGILCCCCCLIAELYVLQVLFVLVR